VFFVFLSQVICDFSGIYSGRNGFLSISAARGRLESEVMSLFNSGHGFLLAFNYTLLV
jgi:hypothetical protein